MNQVETLDPLLGESQCYLCLVSCSVIVHNAGRILKLIEFLLFHYCSLRDTPSPSWLIGYTNILKVAQNSF